jgi:Contractile injection system tape measure protein
MQNSQKHIINQLSVELSVTSEEEAFVLRKELNEVLQNEITAVIDQLCSNYSNTEDTLRIERLEIDLGTISTVNFKRNWVESFKQTFENQLHKANISNLGASQKINKVQSDFELLTGFLKSGRLDWWVISEDINLTEIFEEIIQNQAHFLRDFLINNSHKKQIAQRILFQFSEKSILQFLENIQINIYKYDDIFEEIFRQIKDNDLREIILKNQHEFKLKIIFKSLFQNKFEPISKEQVVLNFAQFIQDECGFSDKKTLEILQEIMPNFQQNNELIKIENEEFIEEITNKITVQNAGIVLIVPYFKHFFQELQLIDNHQFISKKVQYKAIHLIKYLATGKTIFDEFDLTLEKLICGLSLDEPVPRNLVFLEREILEADELLKSVIEHWKVLKNSSPDALRNSFFQREGILQKNDFGWQINIERKTQDILLDSIPWGFSMIVNSWNNYIITVEW